MDFLSMVLVVSIMILANESFIWSLTMCRHISWIHRNPQYEKVLATKYRTLRNAIIFSSLFCIISFVYFIYYVSALYSGYELYDSYGFLFISLIPGIFLTHIHFWALIARYTCLHTRFWPCISKYVNHLLKNITGAEELADYCLFFERWKSLSPLRKIHKSFLPTFFEYTSEYLTIKDTYGRVTYANRSMCNLFGVNEKHLLGKNFAEASHEYIKYLDISFVLDSEKSDRYVLENETIYKGIVKGYLNGSFVAISATKAPVYEEIGDVKKLSGVVCLGVDVTKRWEEHLTISELLQNGKYKEGADVFKKHKNGFEQND